LLINKLILNKTLILLAFIVLIGCKNGESIFSKGKNDRPSPPASTTGAINGASITIDYSSPRVRNRKIWGELVPYNKIWRTGANEATVFSFSSDVKIAGQLIPKGKYSFFTIPGKEEWTVIFNKEWDLWGSYDYEEKKDVLRIKIPINSLSSQSENMLFEINSDYISFKWEKLSFKIKVDEAE